MTFWTIIGNLWPIVSFLVVGFASVIVYAIRAEGRSKQNEATAKEAKQIAEKVADELAGFRERVAQEYATTRMVSEVRTEITNAVNRMADRLDRVLERAAA